VGAAIHQFRAIALASPSGASTLLRIYTEIPAELPPIKRDPTGAIAG